MRRSEQFTTLGRLAWLNEASTRIGTQLDLYRTSQELAQFTVPRFADGTTVDLLEAVLQGEEVDRTPGLKAPRTRAMAVAATDALSALRATPVGQINEIPKEALGTLMNTRVLKERRTALLTHMKRPDFNRVVYTDKGAQTMYGLGVHSYMGVPLIARGVLLGTMEFVRAGDSPPFTATDRAVAEQLASRAAVFIDNARLYGREREHVVTLQRSLLPRATPHTPGLRVHADYAPAVDARGVGGDWYDVMELPGGRTALMVGDVMGHGLPAAATMGRLRAVARTLMTLDMAPDRVLARLDLATRDLEDDQVATCLCAVYDPADASYTLASAGHPPPLLVDNTGAASFVDVPVGAPLGAGVIPYDCVPLKETRGARLVLYTDGLIKTRTDDVDVQLDRLRRAASELSPQSLDEGGLLTSPLGDDSRFDEAVLLVATDAPGRDLRVWELPQEGVAASNARKYVTGQLADWGLAEFGEITELVVSELVGNALRYGNGPGQLRLLRGERLVVEVSDTGPDLPQIQHVDVSDEGGRGLQLINMMCRRWGSCRTPGGKVVWAEQDVAP
ncbi:SpoIIE family protein phosphatase [Streptomyces sp. NA04227]|uniref:SpoIIE family protein phosphatase n=1 Tax=Streptomyces sp. NA04227 TaxID=2742136 RepID=UPI001591EFB3|nr:SpoIIE family protein phosphatase [Streptomyces sp. NA04227]QKW11296.1 SpoIIE family protein phosphatase [Streptomyces sp. NA04227]